MEYYYLHNSQYQQRLKWKNKSAKKMLNNNGASAKLCGTPQTVPNQEL